MKKRRLRGRLNAVGLLLGAGILVALIWRTDTRELGARLSQAWVFFVPAFIGYVLNLIASSLAWRATFVSDAAGKRPTLRTLLTAFWVGHAVNGLTPGATAGELVKGRILAREVGPEESAASLVIYNYWNLVTTLAFTLAAPLFALPFLELPGEIVAGLFGVGASIALALIGAGILLRRGLATPVVRAVSRLPFVHVRDIGALENRAREVDLRVGAFRGAHPARHREVVGYTLLARLLLTAESAFLIWGLFPESGLAFVLPLALLIQSASKLLGWVTAFVPGRVGVAEGGVMMLFGLLGLAPAVGLTYGVFGRLRHLIGTGIGMLLALVFERSRRTPDVCASTTSRPGLDPLFGSRP
ncbi:MAG: flippase-like domain-containing protein [Deltaproteobacteria bacterium]|nr:flippase-like domain-containing protein [Deltaproteobacteria bacterium]